MRIARHVRFGETAGLATTEVGGELPVQQGTRQSAFGPRPSVLD